MRQALVVVFVMLGCSIGAQDRRPSRLSFLKPGQTRYQEVIDGWKAADPDWDGRPRFEWGTEIALEKPDIRLSPHIVPNRPDPPGDETWLDAKPEERARWHIVRVRVMEDSVSGAESPVDDPDVSEVRLAFLLDSAGAPDRLLYYSVSLGSQKLDWDDVVRRYGPPEDEEYVYVQSGLDGEEREKLVYRRFPKHGIGYVWDAVLAEQIMKKYGMKLEEAQKDYYSDVIHFEPEK